MELKKTLDDFELSPYLKKLILFASGGPFLEGYVLVLIGVALVQLEPELKLTSHWSGLIGASSLVGLFIGCSLFGYITDKIGRQKMFTFDIIAIGVLSLLTAFVSTPLQLVILRFLIGVVIGADYPISTSLVTEFTPRKYRAITMGIFAAVWYVGATAADIVGYFLYDIDGGWRWMLGSTFAICAVMFFGRLGTPESPRWLAKKGRVDEAREILKKYFGEDVELTAEEEEKKNTSYKMLFQNGNLGKVFFVGTIWLCQVVPMWGLYLFGPKVMGAFGFGEGRDALIGDIIISIFFLIGCIAIMYGLNRIGRRPLVIWCFAIMTVALTILGIFPESSIIVVVILFGIYAFFSGGPGILQWLYPNELFPTEIRASAVGAAMAFSRIGTVITMYGLPAFLATSGIGVTMLVGVGVSIVGFIVSILFAPETKGLTLAESSALPLWYCRSRP